MTDTQCHSAAIRRLLRAMIGPIALLPLLMAQGEPDPYVIGAALAQPEASCPIFVWSVWPQSPAALAGVRGGDELVAVDEKPVAEIGWEETGARLRSDRPGQVTLKIRRTGTLREVVLDRVRFSSILAANEKKLASGALVPTDTTMEEVRAMNEFDVGRITTTVFPIHYPTDTQLYFVGFEIFVLKEPSQVAIGGMEGGPASRAGLHWGDIILSVNGVDPRGKSVAQLQELFSSVRPGVLRLEVNRMGRTRRVEIQMEQVSEILKKNDRRILNGRIVPFSLSDEAARCLERSSRQ